MLSIGGNNLQFYPNFVLFSTLGGMKLDHYFFHESKSIEDQKKAFTETWRVFVSKIKWRPKNKVQRSTSVQMQTIVKLLGGMQSNYWGGYVRPIPPGFGTLANDHAFARFVSGTLPIRIPGYANAQVLAKTNHSHMYFDSMLSFQDDDNINRLILKYLEKLLLRKNFQDKKF